MNSDDTKMVKLGDQADDVSMAKKPWSVPRVIMSDVQGTAAGPGPFADGPFPTPTFVS
jgi:hypothetical protein